MENAILTIVDMKIAETKAQGVVSDAVYSQLTYDNLMENVIQFKETKIALLKLKILFRRAVCYLSSD